MAKAPAFQFYVRDWLSDPLLRQATPLSRGVWIDVLCFMWEADQRGKLETTPLKLSRMVSASIDEVNHFLNELVDLEFGNLTTENKLPFPITTQYCNEYVTIINRRMYGDYKGKENTRLRVKKHRRKKVSNGDVTEKKQKCNGDVTVTSSSSSSSSSLVLKKGGEIKAFSLPSQEIINESSIPKIQIDLNKICDELYEAKIFPEVHAFKNTMLKKGKNERSVLHTLSRCYLKKTFDKDGGPWAYCIKIINIEDGNYNERDYLKTVPASDPPF